MCLKKKSSDGLIVQTTTRHLPQLQLHSPAVQKNGGGFVVNAWTNTGREAGVRQRTAVRLKCEFTHNALHQTVSDKRKVSAGSQHDILLMFHPGFGESLLLKVCESLDY